MAPQMDSVTQPSPLARRAYAAETCLDARGNTSATSVPSDASTVSRKPRNLAGLEAPERVYTS